MLLILPDSKAPSPGRYPARPGHSPVRTAARLALAVCGAWLALLSSTTAATYYIDFETGRDTHAGTSKTAPWKHAPGMAPFAGTYTPAPGDQLIFKGGVVWTNQMYVSDFKGTAASHIVFRSAADWFKGTAYSRPVLDMQARVLEQGLSDHASHRGNVVWVQGSEYVTIADLEIRNYVWNDPEPRSQSDGFAVYFDTTTGCVVSNVYAHSWAVRIGTDAKFGGFGAFNSASPGSTLINSIVEGPNVLTTAPLYVGDIGCTGRGFCTSGAGVIGFSTVIGNEFSGTTQGIWGGSIVRNNTVRDACDSFDKESHENGTWQMNNTEFSGNVLRNLRAGVGAYFYPGWGGRTNQVMRVFNNIFQTIPQITVIQEGQIDESCEIWFVNNVIHRSHSAITLTSTKSGAPFGALVFQNNLLISDNLDSSSPIVGNPSWPHKFVVIADESKLGSRYTNSHNLYRGANQVVAYGITPDRLYQPSTNFAAAHKSGVNFSWLLDADRLGAPRPATGAWDIGTYQLGFEGVGPLPPGPVSGVQVQAP